MTNENSSEKKGAAVITGKRINPDFLRHLQVKTKVRSADLVAPQKELKKPEIEVKEATRVEETSIDAKKDVIEASTQPLAEMSPIAPVVEYVPKGKQSSHHAEEIAVAPSEDEAQKHKPRPKHNKNRRPRFDDQKQKSRQPEQTVAKHARPSEPKQERILVRPEATEWDDSGDFASLLQEVGGKVERSRYAPGDKVQARIIHLGAESAFLALGQKAEGIMDLSELRDKHGELAYSVGDTIDCFVISAHDQIRLSKKLSRESIDWGMLAHAQANAIPVEGKVEKVCKGGFEVSIGGVRAFCPLGQIDIAFAADQEDKWVGTIQQFLVTQVSETTRNLVVSRRAHLENIRKVSEAELLERVDIGDIVHGKISRIVPFGAFVEFEGSEGLIPLSEISHGFVKNAEQFVRVGDAVSAQITKIEDDPKREGRKRIGLSLKAVMQDPFQEHKQELFAGNQLSGTVLRIERFGAFVELFPGVDGLLHVQEFSKGMQPKIGQTLEVRILEIDQFSHRISLTLGDEGHGKTVLKNSGELKSNGLSALAGLFSGKL